MVPWHSPVMSSDTHPAKNWMQTGVSSVVPIVSQQGRGSFKVLPLSGEYGLQRVHIAGPHPSGDFNPKLGKVRV